MRISKSLAAVALATTAVVGVGVATAGTASALSGSDSATSAHGTWYQVYIGGTNAVAAWHVNLGNTDEEMYLTAADTCGHTFSWAWNDKTQSQWNNAWWTFSCPVAWEHLYPTDNGAQDGRTVTR
ncbi:hypothetical protein ABH931_003725 [Streptacidiphilus sp. MAP12-33]|uniref:hypothetical protein n=1 Tax=Streptacidiphilus sp. MAP12-33 TaxID=3156266 RepID=UPI003510E8D4